MIRATLLALVCAACSTLAQAQTKPELLKKALELHQPAIETVARNIAAQTASQVQQAAHEAVEGLPAERRDAVGREIQADVRRFHDDAETLLLDRAKVLAQSAIVGGLDQRMSDDELRALIAWLESPLAKKYQQAMPELLSDLSRVLVADTRVAIEPKLKALEQGIVKRLSAAQPPPKPAPRRQ